MVGCCWTEEREQALIAFYSEHSCLWDQQHHNRRLRLELLEQLSRRLSDPAASVSVEDVKRKFRNLRTVFHREHRCVQASGTSGRRHLSRWKHYQRLLFLCGSCDKEEDQEEDQEAPEEDQERGNLATSSADRNGSSGHAPPDRFSRSSTPSGGGARRRGAARSLSLDERAPSWLTSGRAHAGPLWRSASSASSARPGCSRRRRGDLRRHWSDSKIQQLISFYSDHRCLWSHRSEGYRNRLLKQGLLETLSSLLSQDQDQADSFTVEDVKTKFRNLRTIFQREHRAAASNKTCGSEDFYLPKWKHYQELMFLCDSCNEKKKGVSKRVKKDPGVPSIAPFKEEVLREAEQRRQQIEEEKLKNREAKKEQRALKRKEAKEAASKETEPSAKKARQEEGRKPSEKQKAVDRNSNKHLCSELNKVIDASDVVIEVLDARDPLGFRCPQLEQAVLQREGNKKLLLVLNKIDLVPKENVQKWLKCLQAEFPVVAFKASIQPSTNKARGKKRKISITNELIVQSRATTSDGSNCLTQILTRLAAKTKNGAPLKVGVVGFPNVGKSSLVNSLKGSLACMAGIKRGITKCMQEVNVSDTVKLLDSPGIIASPTNPQVSLALRGLVVEERKESLLEAVRCLLKQCDQTLVTLQYNIPNFRNSLEFLTMFAKKRGYMQKGGVPNTEQAATVFLADWTGPKVSYHCKGQDTHHPPAYVTDAVVSKMQDDWDLKQLQKGNEETLKGVSFPGLASSVIFTSKGPTAGLVNVCDIPEERPAATEGKPDQNGNNECEETSEEQNKEPKKTPKKPLKKKTVRFIPVPVDRSLASDDAYDFNTDFQ